MSILDRFLQRRGFKSADELDNTPNSDGSPTERETFNKWRAVMNKEELTIPDLKQFLQGQIGMIELRWKDMSLDSAKKAELIPYHTIYKTLEQVLSAPKAEREQLEAQLNQLI